MPNQAKARRKCHEMAPKNSPRSPKAHQMGTKLMPKRAKIPKMTPSSKSIIFVIRVWTDSGCPLGSIFGPKSNKIIQKSRPEMDAGKVSPNDDKIMEKTHVHDDRIPSKI